MFFACEAWQFYLFWLSCYSRLRLERLLNFCSGLLESVDLASVLLLDDGDGVGDDTADDDTVNQHGQVVK